MDLPRLLAGLGHRAADPGILAACTKLAEEHGVYAVDVADKGDCAMLALCASLGLPAGCHLRLRQAAARAVAAEWRADPEGDGAAMALSLQGPNAPLLQSADEYLAAALQPGFFLCEAELKAVANLLDVSIYYQGGGGQARL